MARCLHLYRSKIREYVELFKSTKDFSRNFGYPLNFARQAHMVSTRSPEAVDQVKIVRQRKLF